MAEAKARTPAAPRSLAASLRAPRSRADEPAEERRKIIKPVINAVKILRHLSATGGAERAIELARTLQINPSTCFNILRTLVFDGMLEFDESSKAYRIGPGMLALSRSLTGAQGSERVRPLIRELAERFGATATLWRRDGEDRLVLVEMEYSPGGVRVHMPIGQRLPLLLGSLGRASAPHLGRSKEEIRRGFRTLRWDQPHPFADYWAEVQRAAERGWALDDGQYSLGVTSVAAPVLDAGGKVVFVLACAYLRGQGNERRIREVGEATAALARSLGGLLV